MGALSIHPGRMRFVCPKNPGFPHYNPTTWGWDFSTINPTNFRDGYGFLGIGDKYYLCSDIRVECCKTIAFSVILYFWGYLFGVYLLLPAL